MFHKKCQALSPDATSTKWFYSCLRSTFWPNMDFSIRLHPLSNIFSALDNLQYQMAFLQKYSGYFLTCAHNCCPCKSHRATTFPHAHMTVVYVARHITWTVQSSKLKWSLNNQVRCNAPPPTVTGSMHIEVKLQIVRGLIPVATCTLIVLPSVWLPSAIEETKGNEKEKYRKKCHKL